MKCSDCKYYGQNHISTNVTECFCHELPQPIKLPNKTLPACKSFEAKPEEKEEK